MYPEPCSLEMIDIILKYGGDMRYCHVTHSCHSTSSTSVWQSVVDMCNYNRSESATKETSTALIKLFIKYGAPVDEDFYSSMEGKRSSGYKMYRTIHDLVYLLDYNFLQILMECKVDPNSAEVILVSHEYSSCNHRDVTFPIHMLVKNICNREDPNNSNLKVLLLLLDHGAKINLYEKTLSFVHLPKPEKKGPEDEEYGWYRDREDHGFSVDSYNTVLHHALKSKKHELVKLLLSRGADVSLPSYRTTQSGELQPSFLSSMVDPTDLEMRKIINEYSKYSPHTFKYYEKSSQDKIRTFYTLTNARLFKSVTKSDTPLGLNEDVHKLIFTKFLQLLSHENTNLEALRKWNFSRKRGGPYHDY